MMLPRRPTSLPRWQELAVYVSAGILLLTGVLWLILDRWVRIDGEFGPEHHPAEHWTLIAHAIGAYAFLVVLGALVPVHIPLGWRQRRNRISGVTMVTVCVIVSITALALYYVGDDAMRGQAGLVHWIIGLVGAPALLIHVLRRHAPAIPRRAKSPPRQGRPKRDG